MNESKKVDELKRKLNELRKFKTILSEENLLEFNSLKNEILELLNDTQKIRFKQINFYEIVPDYNSEPDDLPF